MSILDKHLALLQCPRCKTGDLEFAGKKLECRFCHNVYDIVDGLPILFSSEEESIEFSRSLCVSIITD